MKTAARGSRSPRRLACRWPEIRRCCWNSRRPTTSLDCCRGRRYPFNRPNRISSSRDGEGFIVLSPLKFGADSARGGDDRPPVRRWRERSGAAMSSAGKRRQTIAASRRSSRGSPVAGTPWLVTLKVDESEALAAPRRMIRTTIVAWSAVALSAALAAARPSSGSGVATMPRRAQEQRRRQHDPRSRQRPDPLLSPERPGGACQSAGRTSSTATPPAAARTQHDRRSRVGPTTARTLREGLSAAAATSGEIVVETNHRRGERIARRRSR